MQMVAGALLLIACSICAAGYHVAQSNDQFAGKPLLFLAWAFGLAGVALGGAMWKELIGKKPDDAEKK